MGLIRECGDCHVCCVMFRVEGLKKRHEPCRYLDNMVGCMVYGDRPLVCERFECAWKSEGRFLEVLRPDRSGIVFASLANRGGFDVYGASMWDYSCVEREDVAAFLDVLYSAGCIIRLEWVVGGGDLGSLRPSHGVGSFSWSRVLFSFDRGLYPTVTSETIEMILDGGCD